jgi:hypothetical protein
MPNSTPLAPLRLLLFATFAIGSCQALFNITLNDPTTRRSNLTCWAGANETKSDRCELCLIEFFNDGSIGADSSIFRYHCVHKSNGFRRVSARCHGFDNHTDIGYGICTPLPYETFDIHSLCICASHECNNNFTSCRESVDGHRRRDEGPPPPLPLIYRQLEDNVNCSFLDNEPKANVSMESCALDSSPFIDVDRCRSYFSETIVLCQHQSVTPGNDSLSTALSIDNYEQVLDDVLDGIERLQQRMAPVVYNRTQQTFYIALPLESNTVFYQRCYCTVDQCNFNISSCLEAGDLSSIGKNTNTDDAPSRCSSCVCSF